jgi:radical SAM protein with 4Fe4S-binding SPASM domain
MQSGSYAVKQDLNKSSLWKNKPPLLGRLDFELTERCNNNCIHCCINLPADDLSAKKKELSTEQIKQILKEAISLGCMTVRFTGGEPLVREDFEELYVFSRKAGLKVLIFTNATLITPHLVELFNKIPPLEKIEVTVYGMKKPSYETVTRVDGSFESAWRGINLLLDYKIPFVVKAALLSSNKKEIDEFEKWVSTIPWMDKPPSYSMFFDLRCRRDDQKILTRRKDEYIKGMREFCCKFMQPSGEKLFSCGAGCAGGCVDAYGNFQLCMMLRHSDTVYDLKEGSLEDALINFFPKVREAKATNPDYLQRCAKCFLKGLCEQCPAKSWMEHGNLDTPVNYLCEIAHAQARFLGLIKEEENAWQVRDWQFRIRDFVKNG